MKNLKVTVSGEAGTGKTTVAYLIANMLKQYEANVTLKDDSGLSEERLIDKIEGSKRYLENININIETIQTKRTQNERKR